MPRLRRIAGGFGGIALVFALAFIVTFVPPDTSLQELERNGVLRACVPPSYPPLVTNDPERPGIDVEILNAVADFVGVNLMLNPNAAMGRDFNPRNWGITRANCHVLAGGVVDSTLTRSFLDIGPRYAETGWAIIAPRPLEDISGLTVGSLALISGLDRIGLASYLRSQDVTVRVTRDTQQLMDGIANGEFQAGVTEALLAADLADDRGWWVAFLPDELVRYNLVLGLWKGDLTLKRKIVEAFADLESSGELAAILARYGASPDEFGIASE